MITVLCLAALLCGSAALKTEVQESVPTPREETEVLIDEGLALAEKMLREHGELVPFAFVMTMESQVEQRLSRDRLDSLVAELREAALAGRYRAVAIFAAARVLDPRINKKIDAVQVGFEHIDGYCGNLFVPYTLPLEKLDLGEVIATQREGAVFGECP